ncbi:LOW QUALITY PROTEIN: hypothetical protein V2J09_000930 [Rumex salicifolius]
MEIMASQGSPLPMIVGLEVILDREAPRQSHPLPCHRRLRDLWKLAGKMVVMDLSNGYFVVQFEKERNYMPALIGVPWMLFGHYHITKEWLTSFNSETDVLSTSSACVKMKNLPMECYRGALENIDLLKSLKCAMNINRVHYFLQYENLHPICIECGRYGHLISKCHLNQLLLDPSPKLKIPVNLMSEPPKTHKGSHGIWMLPTRKVC